MARTYEPQTVVPRILECLNDLYNQIVTEGDSQPRVMYTVMTYRLSLGVVGALQREGIVRRDGWNYTWIGPKPTLRMAQNIRESYLEVKHTYFPLKRPAAPVKGKAKGK